MTVATQGVVSVTKGGKVVLKVVAGCDGYNAKKLAEAIRETDTPEQVFTLAGDCGFGCEECLVVQTPDGDFGECAEELPPLYREKFADPRFNPRWEHGSADCVCVRSESGIECD